MPQQAYLSGVTDNAGSSDLSALLRINSYLNDTLDLRSLAALATAPHTAATTTSSSNSIDSLWSNLVSGGDSNRVQPSTRAKAHSVCSSTGLDMSSVQLNQLLSSAAAAAAVGNGYTGAGDQCLGVRPQLSCSSAGPLTGAGGIFAFHQQQQQHRAVPQVLKEDCALSSSGGGSSGGHTPPSAGGCSSITSPTHFQYSSPTQAHRITLLSNVSEPGSPSLDDAIMMGIQHQRQQQQQQQQQQQRQQAAEKMTDVSLADLVSSLNLSGSTGGGRPLSSSSGVGTASLGVPSSSALTALSSSLNSTLGSLTVSQGVDLSQLAQLQGSLNGSGGWGRGGRDTPYTNLSYAPAQQHGYQTNSLPSTTLQYNNRSGSGGLDMLASLDRTPLTSFLASQDPYSIEKAAKMHRTAAAVCEATCTWSGQLPVRMHKNPFYSCKVFLGGVPWDVTEAALRQTFLHFGNIQVEWPGKENSANPPKGYVYILFDNEKQVKNLLSACSQDFSNGGNYYFKISSRRMRQKEVQVIPWVMSDSNYVRCPSYQLDPHKTVFVGALHGMLSAEALANIINDLFGGVVYAGIDTDKHKYPIGSGRITFNNLQSYRKAVRAAFVEIKTPKFTKKVQIDPYLADSLCQMCGMQQGPYFCRDETCFKYFCRTCWLVTPYHQSTAGCHKPLMRNSKLRTQTRLSGLV